MSLEQMVPANHLLRQIDAAIDFNRVYEFVGDLYCKDNGRPSIDPVGLFKIVLIQHIYRIRSLRRTLEEIEMNMAYRWFIRYPLNEQVPHFSTVSYNFKHRFNSASVALWAERISKCRNSGLSVKTLRKHLSITVVTNYMSMFLVGLSASHTAPCPPFP